MALLLIFILLLKSFLLTTHLLIRYVSISAIKIFIFHLESLNSKLITLSRNTDLMYYTVCNFSIALTFLLSTKIFILSLSNINLDHILLQLLILTFNYTYH